MFSEFRSNTDKEALKDIIFAQCDKLFDRKEGPEDPVMCIPRLELRAEYKKAIVEKTAYTKSEIKAKNISENNRRGQEKSARREAVAPESSDPLAAKKRVSSTEFPRGSEDDRVEKRRATLMANACKLREQLERVKKELEKDTRKGGGGGGCKEE